MNGGYLTGLIDVAVGNFTDGVCTREVQTDPAVSADPAPTYPLAGLIDTLVVGVGVFPLAIPKRSDRIILPNFADCLYCPATFGSPKYL